MRHRSAVTLLEMLMVLAILAFVTTISIPSIQSLFLRNQIHQACTALIDITNEAKLLAVSQGVNVTITYSIEHSALRIDTDSLNAPVHLNGNSDNLEKLIHDSFQFEFRESGTNQVVSGIRVSPVGEITPAQVSLNRRNQVLELFETHRLTGEMRRVKK